jgi:hypothetical protein
LEWPTWHGASTNQSVALSGGEKYKLFFLVDLLTFQKLADRDRTFSKMLRNGQEVLHF